MPLILAAVGYPHRVPTLLAYSCCVLQPPCRTRPNHVLAGSTACRPCLPPSPLDHANHLPGFQHDTILGLDPHVKVAVAVFCCARLRAAMAAFPAALSALEGPQAPRAPGRAGCVPVAEGHQLPPLPLSSPPSLSSPPRLPGPPPLRLRTTPLPPRPCPHAAATVGASNWDGPSSLGGNRYTVGRHAPSLEDHIYFHLPSGHPPPTECPAGRLGSPRPGRSRSCRPWLHWEVDSSGHLARFAGTRLYTVEPSSELTALPHDAIPAPRTPWLPCYGVSWKRVSRRNPSLAGRTLHYYDLTASITLLPDHHAYWVKGDDLMHRSTLGWSSSMPPGCRCTSGSRRLWRHRHCRCAILLTWHCSEVGC